jgi:hypothetical protein
MNGIDPMALLNPLPQISAVEPLDTFLTRTLMTGTDIAGVSLDMISSYADITLTTALPL